MGLKHKEDTIMDLLYDIILNFLSHQSNNLIGYGKFIRGVGIQQARTPVKSLWQESR